LTVFSRGFTAATDAAVTVIGDPACSSKDGTPNIAEAEKGT
jgi:hypothetical protein